MSTTTTAACYSVPFFVQTHIVNILAIRPLWSDSHKDTSDRENEDRTKSFSQAMKPLAYLLPPLMPTEMVTSTRIVRSMGRARPSRLPHVHSQAASSLTHTLETPTFPEAPPRPVLSLDRFPI